MTENVGKMSDKDRDIISTCLVFNQFVLNSNSSFVKTEIEGYWPI
jgi:hypothetical protein